MSGVAGELIKAERKRQEAFSPFASSSARSHKIRARRRECEVFRYSSAEVVVACIYQRHTGTLPTEIVRLHFKLFCAGVKIMCSGNSRKLSDYAILHSIRYRFVTGFLIHCVHLFTGKNEHPLFDSRLVVANSYWSITSHIRNKYRCR